MNFQVAKSVLFFIAFVGFSHQTCNADIIMAYTPNNGTTENADVSGAGVTAAPLSRGSGAQDPGGTGSGFDSRGLTANSFSVALSQNDFIEFGFSSALPYDLSSLAIRYGRSAGTGIFGPPDLLIQMDTSGTGSSFSTIFTDPDSIEVGGEEHVIDLSSFTGLTEAIFRVYAWDADDANGLLSILPSTSTATGFDGSHGLILNGTLAAVPEPSSFLFFALLGFAGFLWKTTRAKT